MNDGRNGSEACGGDSMAYDDGGSRSMSGQVIAYVSAPITRLSQGNDDAVNFMDQCSSCLSCTILNLLFLQHLRIMRMAMLWGSYGTTIGISLPKIYW